MSFGNVNYRVYSALLTQSGTNAPVAVILENTLGENVNWSYSGTGIYYGNITGGFPIDKTFILNGGPDTTTFGTIQTERLNDGSIQLVATEDGVLIDGLLLKCAIEIRIYN